MTSTPPAADRRLPVLDEIEEQERPQHGHLPGQSQMGKPVRKT